MAPVPRVARFNEELAQGAGKSIEECEMRVEDYFRRRCHVMCVLESTIGEFAEQGVRAVFVDGERRAWADVGDPARVVVGGVEGGEYVERLADACETGVILDEWLLVNSPCTTSPLLTYELAEDYGRHHDSRVLGGVDRVRAPPRDRASSRTTILATARGTVFAIDGTSVANTGRAARGW